jgi:Tol biopolymer transport system component
MRRIWIPAILLLLFSGCSRNSDKAGVISFQSSRDGNFEIYVMNMDGTSQRRVTNSPSNDISPSISPDDTAIVFASDRSGNWEIYSVKMEGGEPRALTAGQGSNSAPTWAMGGTKVLFVSTRDAINGELYLMNPDGTGVERLTRDSLVKDTPVMTTDGHTALVTVTEHDRRGIAAVTSPGGRIRMLTSMDHNNIDPALSPDGKSVAFASSREGRFQIYSMTLDGQNVRRLTNDADVDVQPWWLPSGNAMLFARRGQIFLFSLTDAKETLLSFKGDGAPRCSP